MNNKVLTLLGFASKAGKLSFGYSAMLAALADGKAKLVLTAMDVSEKSRKESAFFAEKNKVPYFCLLGADINELSHAVGRKCGVISVNDEGFANSCTRVLTEGGNADDK